jgi:hypothetical protein
VTEETPSSVETQIAFLEARGAAAHSHSLSNLMAHLIGTRRWLASWGAGVDLCAAGLFHSMYGTESYAVATIDPALRTLVQGVIGREAERLVYIFSVMSRESFDAALGASTRWIVDRTSGEPVELDEPTFRDLCTLSAANWLEQHARLPQAYRAVAVERCVRMLPILPAPAKDALRKACGI